ncbi:MAG TPA: hypothetical protein VFW93_18750 [Aquabacterium sp.]|uniref:hypothetical protein n=1 Tax=Aquabacterium sp. TaxID=1872578 RepID=UPI002E30FEF1|nr:hypothetical protein [Aquabacterium sp.]HEX5358248.1 hypothetical protein [Aquabacterium sp.]
MQLESVAVLFVFIGNAAAIILLAFMLFRILGQTETTHTLMRQGTDELMGAAKRLHEMLSSVDRLSDRLLDANKQASHANSQAINISQDSLQKIAALTDSLTREGIEEHEGMMDEMRELLESLQRVDPDGYTAWRQDNQGKLDHTLTQRSHLATELEQVKIRLDEANIVINELRRANRLAEASTQSAEVLRQNMDQQQQLLNRAKERAQKAEATANTLTQEVEKLQAEVDHARHSAEKDIEDLRSQMEAITQERTILFNQLEELKNTMKRTLLEKDFIEDKLLDLDEAHRSSVADDASSASDTSPVREPAN